MRSPNSYRYFDLIMAAFVAVLLISNIASNKLVQLGPIEIIDGGTILFPLSYIFADVLTEVYGYAKSRRVIWTGFTMNILLAVIIWVMSILPAAAGEEEHGAAFNFALGSTFYIVLGSLVAYLAGEFANSMVLARMKVATSGRFLWARTIGSTLVGELIDTLLFTGIAFGLGGAMTGNPLPGEVFWSLFFANYVLKVGVEILFTPVTYAIVGFLKRTEQEDHYDTNTNFNPFAMSSSGQS